MNYNSQKLVVCLHELYDTPEIHYILEQVLSGFLELKYEIFFSKEANDDIILLKREDKFIQIDFSFFKNYIREDGIKGKILPSTPLGKLSVGTKLNILHKYDIPILFGEPVLHISIDSILIGIDVFGSAFFMLTRLEEIYKSGRDEHDRFSLKSSILSEENLVEYPIVDIYVDLLGKAILKLWPDKMISSKPGRLLVSCDVDFLYEYNLRGLKVLKRLARNILLDRSLYKFIETLKRSFAINILGNLKYDSYNSYDYLMRSCEKEKVDLAFYFIARNKKEKIDGNYDISSPDVLRLIQRIFKRGHEIGLHGSYYSYDNFFELEQEKQLLVNVLEKSGLSQDVLKGGRQHYLRWNNETSLIWDKNGLIYDSTLGFAEHVGFRCGTSKEYNFFDVINRKQLNIVIRPLICMEVSLLDKKYMNLDHKHAFPIASNLKKRCLDYGGNFTLLWHNSSFNHKEDYELFEKIIKNEGKR
ncbi:polysaccharide deacetylase family protein [Robertkochia aurantiaca]|uniref:polysaccharide deacetylase family protein n=1 Tax=Robertkochia aurantiaca TaxID=2873700 RepID=UPI001CCD3E9D|nr:polysaccharide deacetylase family protein [Robertkochia sp. 3YJGBD-33]